MVSYFVQLLTIHGISPDSSASLMGWYFGIALLGMGLAIWLIRNLDASEAKRAVVLGFFILYISGMIVSLYGNLTGQMNALGWLVVSGYSLLVVGSGCICFTDQVKQ